MATLGGSRQTLFSNRMRRRLYGKPGGCTTRKKKTEAKRWGLRQIEMGLEVWAPESILGDIPWHEGNLPGPEVRNVLTERSGL